MADDPMDDFERDTFTHDGSTRDVFRTGSGPAVIVERETSTVVTSPFYAVMQDDGSLLLIRKGAVQ